MKVLDIGGTGTISSACVAGPVRQGTDVHVLNRGRTTTLRPLPGGHRLALAALAPLAP